jgi:uncharacterized protein
MKKNDCLKVVPRPAKDTTIMRDRNRATVEELFERLEVMDVDGWVDAWAEDGVIELPFAPEGFPRRVEGKAAIRVYCRGISENFRAMRFSDLEIHDMLDPERFFVTYEAEVDLAGGGTYQNLYAVLFGVRDGRVVELREYFDPIRVIRAFGGPPGGGGAAT